jgi:hypothetical protein
VCAEVRSGLAWRHIGKRAGRRTGRDDASGQSRGRRNEASARQISLTRKFGTFDRNTTLSVIAIS